MVTIYVVYISLFIRYSRACGSYQRVVVVNEEATEPNEPKVNKASGRGLLFVSAFYVFIAGYIDYCFFPKI